MPTVKEMHLQRVATMAAAAATAQQISADVESHEQFAKELRSYRSQAVGGGQRRVTKPSWESDVGAGGSFGGEYPPSGPGTLIYRSIAFINSAIHSPNFHPHCQKLCYRCYACAQSAFNGVPEEVRWQTSCVTCSPPCQFLSIHTRTTKHQ